jgi:serine/threonine protein kinase
MNEDEEINLIRKFCKKPNLKNLTKLSSKTKQIFLRASQFCIKNNLGKKDIAQIVVGNESKIEKYSTIYLDISKREELIKQIKNSMVGVSLENGNQCVNGPKKQLLKNLELKKLIGKGSFGNVYAGCSPIPCNDNSYKFAIKLATMNERSFINPYSPNSQPWHEVFILKNLINPIVKSKRCPNLPIVAESYTCKNCNFIFGEKDKTKTSPCLILLMELASGDMTSWLEKKPTELQLYSSLFQIMAGIHAIQLNGQIMNNDVKAPNILYYEVEPGGFWHYIIHGIDFYVPNYGQLFILNDFGVSKVFDPYLNLTNSKSQKNVFLGYRNAMVINGKFSPFTCKRNFNTKNKVIPLHKYSWEKQIGCKNILKEAPDSVTVAVYKKVNTTEIIDPIIEFTQEQIYELQKFNIPNDSSSIEFYNHPEIIPPFEFKADTQDVIKIFLGGTRTSQDGFHFINKNIVPNNMKKQMFQYQSYNKISVPKSSTNPAEILAGYFIEQFFTKDHDFTVRYLTSEIIGTYRLS